MFRVPRKQLTGPWISECEITAAVPRWKQAHCWQWIRTYWQWTGVQSRPHHYKDYTSLHGKCLFISLIIPIISGHQSGGLSQLFGRIWAHRIGEEQVDRRWVTWTEAHVDARRNSCVQSRRAKDLVRHFARPPRLITHLLQRGKSVGNCKVSKRT